MMSTATETEIIANRELWIAALSGESGKKYRQHRKALASQQYKTFCCLGVACEAVPALGCERSGSWGNSGANYRDAYSLEIWTGQLGIQAALKLGMSDGMQIWLMQLNDTRRVPLKVIGTVIRELPIAYDYWVCEFTGFEFEAGNDIVRKALEPYGKEYGRSLKGEEI